MWDHVGMARDARGLEQALRQIRELKQVFYRDLRVTGDFSAMNNELEKASRVAYFFELAELMTRDAL